MSASLGPFRGSDLSGVVTAKLADQKRQNRTAALRRTSGRKRHILTDTLGLPLALREERAKLSQGLRKLPRVNEHLC